MWDRVYAQVNNMEVEIEGQALEVVSFRVIAEIDGRAYLATQVITQSHYEDFPEQYGHILDEMVEFIDKQAAGSKEGR